MAAGGAFADIAAVSLLSSTAVTQPASLMLSGSNAISSVFALRISTVPIFLRPIGSFHLISSNQRTFDPMYPKLFRLVNPNVVLFSNMLFFFKTLKVVFLDIIADFIYFPIWWYTRGLFRQIRSVFKSLYVRQDALAIGVWLKNLNKPMYGQYDMSGRIISFFARLSQIIGRSIWLLIWMLILLVWILLWLLIPVAIVYLIYVQIANFL